MVKLGAVLIIARNQKRYTKWSGHDGLLTVGTLTEPQGQVADSLGAALNSQGLVVVEGMGLALNSGVLNHGSSIGLQSGHGAADMAVDLDNLLDG